MNSSSFFDLLFEELRSGAMLFSRPSDVFLMIIDMLVTSTLIYFILKLMSDTRAWQVLKGLMFILLATQVANIIGLQGFSFLLNSSISLLAVGFVIIFQPELRKALETMGRNSLSFLQNGALSHEEYSQQLRRMIDQISIACEHMAHTYTGALIVVERRTRLGELLEQGQSVILNSDLSATALEQIFYKGSPLHDGALLIREGKIFAARCHVPLSDSFILKKDHGTRHRAAIGASEIGDAIGIVVSEERGVISIALSGRLYTLENADALRTILHKLLIQDQSLDISRSLKSSFLALKHHFFPQKGSTPFLDDQASQVLIPEVEEDHKKENLHRRRVLLHIASIALSFVFWFYAQMTTNPIKTRTFSTNLQIKNVHILDEKDLQYSKDALNIVQISLRGRERFLNALNSDQISAFIDFEDLEEQILDEIKDKKQEALSLTVHIQVQNAASSNYRIANQSPNKVTINISFHPQSDEGKTSNQANQTEQTESLTDSTTH